MAEWPRSSFIVTRFIDLFSGLGGFRVAFEALNSECVFSSEIDKDACDVYEANFYQRPHGDITKIKAHKVPSHEILCAGFPCQAFSISGKQLGFNDIRGSLFFDIARIAKFKKPKVIFLENVKNFKNHDQGRTYSVLNKTLKKLGYQVFDKIISSSDFGVPQFRERIYIVAFRNDLDCSQFKFPKNKKHKLVKDILIDLKKKDLEKLIINRSDIYLDKNLKVENSKKPFKLGIINKGGQGERIYSIEAQGITLSANGGGAAAKTGAYLIKGKIRKLHPSECLLMQGFPKKYKLNKSFNISWRLIGNSVSVPVIKEIGKEILKIIQINNEL